MSEQTIRQLTSRLLDALEDETVLDVEASSDLRWVLRELQEVNTALARAESLRLTPALLRSVAPVAWAHAWGFSTGTPPPALDAPPEALQGLWLWHCGYTSPPMWLLREWGDPRAEPTIHDGDYDHGQT